jgi:Zn-dependent peptidase ImmA (M78 family)
VASVRGVASFYKTPATLLDELGIREPEDIAIEAIAQYCGATILYQPLQGAEARIVGSGDRAIITVNAAAARGRQRFSGAHELGHWMCDRGKIAFTCAERALTREWEEDNPERRANQYAAELLLPEPMFSARAKRLEITFATVRQLAETFQTSLTATAIRLVEFGSFPALLVCSEAERRRWFKRGPDVPGVLWPRERVSPMTGAYDILKGAATAPGPTDVSADAWFEHRDARRYAIREDSMRITGDLILSLLWWKDESQLLDLEDDENEDRD